MNFLLKIQYIGTAYCGWQKQDNGSSIQEEIEKAIFSATNCKVQVIGSGRTDSGVHALGQVANVHIDTKIPAQRLKYALNYYLPWDIRITESFLVDEDFHAQYHAKKKTYCYRVNTCDVENPFEKNKAYFVGRKLDLEKMRQVAVFFVGEHDFAAFRSEGSSAKTTVRTIYSLNVEENAGIVEIRISGNGFLYNMVRIIAGTLVEIGKGKNYDMELLLREGKREDTGHTAPACGLFLEKVEYGIDIEMV